VRCLSCNRNLTDFEATRRYTTTEEFLDLCNRCFASVSEDLHTIERSDLAHDEDETDFIDDINHCGLDCELDSDD
jgi:hypothetical protein